MSGADLIRSIKQVQNLIEGCIQHNMNKSECKHDLQFHHKIHPYITEIIWCRLEKENEEFFRAYYGRLVLIKQIMKFNMLVAKQASSMYIVRRLYTMHTSDSTPALNRYFQENDYMSGYDVNFGSSQNLVDPQNQDAMMTKTESVITGEAGYDGNLACNPAPYEYFEDLSPLTGDDASINALSSNCTSITSTPTKQNNLYLEASTPFYLEDTYWNNHGLYHELGSPEV